MRRVSFWLALFTVALVGFVVLMTGVLPAQTATQTPPQADAAGEETQNAPGPDPAPGASRRGAPAERPVNGRALGGQRAVVPGGTRRPRAGTHQAPPGPGHDQGLPPRLDLQRAGHVLESRKGIRRLGHGNQDRHGMGHQEGQLPGRRPLARLLRCDRAGELHRQLEAGRRTEGGAALLRPRRRQGARGGARVARRQLRLAGIRRDDRRLVPGSPLGHVRRAGHRRGPDFPGHAAFPQVPPGCTTRCTRRSSGRATRSTC